MSNTSTKNTENAQTATATTKATKAKAAKPTVKKVAKVKAEITPEIVAEIPAVKTPTIRKTSDEKVVELKMAIERQFGVNQEQIINFTINKLAKSAKKVNLIEFYETLIVQIVLNPELIFKF